MASDTHDSSRRRLMLALFSGGAAVTLSACDDMPGSAIAPWNGPAAGEGDTRLRALSWALLAPNPHNLQSWIADLRVPNEVTLLLDPARLLPATDPYARQILIGCGAFIELLRMAAAQEGRAVAIEPFPQGAFAATGVDVTKPVARIRWLEGKAEADPLFAAVRDRRTNRAPYERRIPEAQVLRTIADAVRTEGIATHFATAQDQVAAIGRLAAEGYRVEFATPAAFAESAHVVRVGAEEIAREPSGIAVHGTGIWWARTLGLMSRKDVFDPNSDGSRRIIDKYVSAMAATPVWVWQTSADNTRPTQLAAGRAYMRLALAATRAGVAMHPNSQTLQEFPEMGALYERMHATAQVRAPERMQMLARMGYAEAPGPAPRRPLSTLVQR
jgi:hypothetical protein